MCVCKLKVQYHVVAVVAKQNIDVIKGELVYVAEKETVSTPAQGRPRPSSAVAAT